MSEFNTLHVKPGQNEITLRYNTIYSKFAIIKINFFDFLSLRGNMKSFNNFTYMYILKKIQNLKKKSMSAPNGLIGEKKIPQIIYRVQTWFSF